MRNYIFQFFVLHILSTYVQSMSIHKRSIRNVVTNQQLIDAIDVIERAKVEQALTGKDNDYSENFMLYQPVETDLDYPYEYPQQMDFDKNNFVLDMKNENLPDETDPKRPLEQSEVASLFETSPETEKSENKVTLGPGQVADLFKPDEKTDPKEDKNPPDGTETNIQNVDDAEQVDQTLQEENNSNKEWLQLLSNSADQIADNNKAKRSTEPIDTSDGVNDDLKGKAIAILKEYIEQQQEENSHLAKALNLATKSQVERTDRYVLDEISHIEEAALNEKAINDLKNLIAKDILTYSKNPNKNEAKDDEKRNLVPVENSVNPTTVLSGGIEDKEEKLLLGESKVKENLENEVYEEIINDKLEDLLSQKDDEDDEKLVKEYNRYRLNPFIRNIELDDSEENDLNPDESCHVVDSLSDDCLVATSNQLELDPEAIDLCNRHQLCYTCGSYHGISAELCDRLYTSEAARACEQEEDEVTCHREAFGLYAIMVQGHEPSPGLPPAECASSCVYDFIVGG